MSVGSISANSYDSLAAAALMRLKQVVDQQDQTALSLIQSATDLQVPVDPNNTISVEA